MIYTSLPITAQDSEKICNFLCNTVYKEQIQRINDKWESFINFYKKKADEFFKDCPPSIIQYCNKINLSHISLTVDSSLPAIPRYKPLGYETIDFMCFASGEIGLFSQEIYYALCNSPLQVVWRDLKCKILDEHIKNYQVFNSTFDRDKKKYLLYSSVDEIKGLLNENSASYYQNLTDFIVQLDKEKIKEINNTLSKIDSLTKASICESFTIKKSDNKIQKITDEPIKAQTPKKENTKSIDSDVQLLLFEVA